MTILFFQHGDFAEAWRRLQAGEPETYRDQHASVAHVAALRAEDRIVTIVSDDRHSVETLDENLLSVTIDRRRMSRADLWALLDSHRPDRIVCRAPDFGVLRWARHNRVPTLPVFADIFANRSARAIWGNLRLRAILSSPVFPCVANHSLNASRSVARALAYPASRIVPWDWSALPVQDQAKPAVADPTRPTAFFAGMLQEAKGVGDCLDAVRLLRDRGLELTFEFAGPGDIAAWQAAAAARGIADRVRFPGRIPHAEVRARMRASDIVVVPSRHDYAEGLPNTIYEALASRSPLVMSDHPAFAGRLGSGEDCLVFEAANPAALADRIAALTRDPALYARLSRNAAAAHDSLYVGTEWARLVSTFLADPQNRTGWVDGMSLQRLAREGRLGGTGQTGRGRPA